METLEKVSSKLGQPVRVGLAFLLPGQQGNVQRQALPALGRAAERRPTGKMLRRRKMLGIAPDSPASGARFVGRFLLCKTCWLKEDNSAKFLNHNVEQ